MTSKKQQLLDLTGLMTYGRTETVTAYTKFHRLKANKNPSKKGKQTQGPTLVRIYLQLTLLGKGKISFLQWSLGTSATLQVRHCAQEQLANMNQTLCLLYAFFVWLAWIDLFLLSLLLFYCWVALREKHKEKEHEVGGKEQEIQEIWARAKNMSKLHFIVIFKANEKEITNFLSDTHQLVILLFDRETTELSAAKNFCE